MILDEYPELRRLDHNRKAQLVAELVDDMLESEIELPPELLAAIEERVSFNNTHPELVSSMEKLTAKLHEAKVRIAAQRSHG